MMTCWEFYQFCEGKAGSVYIARKGTVTVVEIEGATYILNNFAGFAVVETDADWYWVNSIDWAGGFNDYFALGMYPDDNPRIKADPIIPITVEQKEHLKAAAEYRKNKKES